MIIAKPLEEAIEQLQKLPAIGPKSAQRLAYYLLRMPKDEVEAIAKAIVNVKSGTVLCGQCFNIAEQDPCSVCTDISRDQSLVCVVEEPLDLLAIEKTNQYKGLYHVLHGVISPINNIGPDDLYIHQLKTRLATLPKLKEIILATNPSMEGEATAMYIGKLLKDTSVRITRIAHGLPVGGDMEYADALTLTRALEGRRELE